jgi:hypothetical protein
MRQMTGGQFNANRFRGPTASAGQLERRTHKH